MSLEKELQKDENDRLVIYKENNIKRSMDSVKMYFLNAPILSFSITYALVTNSYAATAITIVSGVQAIYSLINHGINNRLEEPLVQLAKYTKNKLTKKSSPEQGLLEIVENADEGVLSYTNKGALSKDE